MVASHHYLPLESYLNNVFYFARFFSSAELNHIKNSEITNIT